MTIEPGQHKVTLNGTKYVIQGGMYKDQYVDLMNYDLMVREASSNKVIGRSAALLKYDGSVKKNGWDQGPVGSDKLVAIRGSTTPEPIVANIVSPAFVILKEKHGLKSTRIGMDTMQEVQEVAEAAAAAGHLNENLPFALVAQVMNCSRSK